MINVGKYTIHWASGNVIFAGKNRASQSHLILTFKKSAWNMTKKIRFKSQTVSIFLVVSICEDTHDMGLSKRKKQRRTPCFVESTCNQLESSILPSWFVESHDWIILKMPHGCKSWDLKTSHPKILGHVFWSSPFCKKSFQKKKGCSEKFLVCRATSKKIHPNQSQSLPISPPSSEAPMTWQDRKWVPYSNHPFSGAKLELLVSGSVFVFSNTTKSSVFGKRDQLFGSKVKSPKTSFEKLGLFPYVGWSPTLPKLSKRCQRGKSDWGFIIFFPKNVRGSKVPQQYIRNS